MYVSRSMINEMSDIMKHFDSVFHQATPGTLKRFRGNGNRSACAHAFPAVDCMTRDNKVIVRADIPGIDPEQVEITVENGRLILRGEKHDTRDEGNADLHFSESFHGKFERSLTLPEDVATDDISASCKNGVLEIVLPLGEVEKARKIPILTGKAGS